MNYSIRLTVLASFFLFTCLAQKTAAPAKPAGGKPAGKSAHSASPTANTLPAGAEKIGEYKWRYKDAAGKTWIYVQTPFGFSKVDEETYLRQRAETSASDSPASMIKVVMQTEDTVTFEMATPFGKQRWQKKRAELGEKEKAALSAASEPAAAAKE